jgi:cysteine-rich repeat protein
MFRACLVVLLTVVALAPVRAGASTADDICGAGADPCVVTGARGVTPGSVLDFGARALQLRPSATLAFSGGTLTILAGSVRMEGGSTIVGTAANATVPAVHITATGGIRVETAAAPARIQVSDALNGGQIVLEAGGDAELLGTLDARGDGNGGAGGVIDVTAGGNVTLGGTTMLRGGSLGIGGLLTVVAAGGIAVPGSILANADDGGEVDLQALGGDVTLDGPLDVSAGGNYGDGGFVTIVADRDVALRGTLAGQGAGSDIEGGGSGADVTVTATAGSIAVAGALNGNGAPPDGDGGEFDFTAGTDFTQSANILLQDNGADGCGGLFSVSAGRQASFAAAIEANGGFCGGDVYVDARGGAALAGEVNADGGEIAGSIEVTAPTLSASGRVHASGTGNAAYAGILALRACELTVPAGAVVQSNGPSGGQNLLQASGQMTIGGSLSSRPAGTNRLEYRDPLKLPRILSGASVNPVPVIVANPTLPVCTINGAVCGNGVRETNEGCDDGNPTACDGCSPTCQPETCGNRVIECAEECDDGPANGGPGNRCDGACRVVDVGPQVFIPGSHRGPAACLAEWAVRNPGAETVRGFPSTTQTCVDGDPGCDTDGATDGGCSFAVNACLAATDPRVPACQPAPITWVKLRRPNPLAPADPVDAANAAQLVDAFEALGVTVYYRDTILHQGEPQPGRDRCSQTLSLRVPHATGAIGRRIFALAAADAAGQRMRRNRITLACAPNPAVCGNGTLEIGESCDDGNTADCDGCSAGCRVERCGDGVVQCGEDCDHGSTNGTPGDPCSAECTEVPAPLRIPGGKSATDCTGEYALAIGTPALLKGNLPSTRQACVDGDPTCDFDPTPGTCRLHLWACLGGADDRIACAASGVSSARVDRPSAAQTGPAASARAALVAAFERLAFPLPPGEKCTRRIDLDLPAGRTKLIVRTQAQSGAGPTDRDGLKLACLPRSE